ncbi:MAG: hypothetical protein WBA74_14510 [Cyclobacteriaceae bacterium]
MIPRSTPLFELLLDLNINNFNIILSNGYVMQKAFSIPRKNISVLNIATVSKIIYVDWGSFAPAEIKLRNIQDRHDPWMMKLFPKEDREPNILQYSPTIVLAPRINFGRELREYLDLLFDNCVEFKLFQCYMSPELPEYFTSRGKYIMHLIGQQLHITWDEVTEQDYYQKGDYIVTTLIRDTPMF